MKELAMLLAAAALWTVAGSYAIKLDKELDRELKQREAFMAECSNDMKAYECALQWRSLDK